MERTMEPLLTRHNHIWENNLIFRSLEVTAITAACALLTKFAMKEAQRLSKWNIEPFKGNVPPNLAFGTLFIAYISFGLRVTKVHPLKNFHQFLTDILNSNNIVRDNTLIERNMVQYGDKDAILPQLNSPRYNLITLNGAAITKDGTAGDQLLQFLTGEPNKLSEERAVRVLNQLEAQVFGDPTIDIQAFFFQILPSATIGQDERGATTYDLGVAADSFNIQVIRPMRIIHGTDTLAYFSLTVNLSIPKEEATPETASYTWTITEVNNLI
jgi:hypothetical protein